MRYLATTVISENWFRRILRKMGLNKKGNFIMELSEDCYEVNEILTVFPPSTEVKILKKL